jgi:hypothetical protein
MEKLEEVSKLLEAYLSSILDSGSWILDSRMLVWLIKAEFRIQNSESRSRNPRMKRPPAKHFHVESYWRRTCLLFWILTPEFWIPECSFGFDWWLSIRWHFRHSFSLFWLWDCPGPER